VITLKLDDGGSIAAARSRILGIDSGIAAWRTIGALRLGKSAETVVLPILRSEEPSKTGNLRSTTTAHLSGTGLHVTVEFTTEAPYAQYVLLGTRPHLIVARSGGALAFDVAGGRVFAKVVHHPGTKPNDFLTRTVERAKPLLNALAWAELRRAVAVP
jgi:hypothetical protein